MFKRSGARAYREGVLPKCGGSDAAPARKRDYSIRVLGLCFTPKWQSTFRISSGLVPPQPAHSRPTTFQEGKSSRPIIDKSPVKPILKIGFVVSRFQVVDVTIDEQHVPISGFFLVMPETVLKRF